MTGYILLKIHYDAMTDAEIASANEILKKPGIILSSEMGISEKIALRIFIAVAGNNLGRVHIICIPKSKDTGLSPQIRAIEAGFPERPSEYTYNSALKFEKPIRVERMTEDERTSILSARQNRSEGG